jgi:hypothetical protein
MVFAHAGALTFVAIRIPTSGCALLLFAIRLDNIDLAVFVEALRDGEFNSEAQHG